MVWLSSTPPARNHKYSGILQDLGPSHVLRLLCILNGVRGETAYISAYAYRVHGGAAMAAGMLIRTATRLISYCAGYSRF